jgi:hypothetical protein
MNKEEKKMKNINPNENDRTVEEWKRLVKVRATGALVAGVFMGIVFMLMIYAFASM